jgi:hypothetical protein
MPTVSVASKLPHGLRLQLQQPIEVDEPVMGGGVRSVTRHQHYGNVVLLKGAAVTPQLGGEHRIEGGFAITAGVDADFFNKWMEQNKDHDAVKNGFIFAAEKPADVSAHIKLMKGEAGGFEPTDPSSLPAEFKKKIATADVGG